MNELTTIDEKELAQLALLAGADPEANRGPSTPILKVNMDEEDDAGNTLPRGHLFVENGEQIAFAKEVTIRPLTHHLQYQHYDPDENKMENVTVLNTSFKEDFIDRKGGTRCGRPEGKVWKSMDSDAREPYKNISCVRQVGVLVSYTGKDAKGNEVTVENQPAFLKLKGTNFMPFEEEFVKRMPKGRMLWEYDVKITLDRQKNGSVTYYIMHFAGDWDNPKPINRPTYETLRYFLELIDKENKRVREDYNEALRNRSVDNDVYDAIGSPDDLENDLEDA